jgi:thioredoxin 1
MMEEPNRPERELRETRVQETVRLPRRKPNFSRGNISTQTRGKILARQNFAPGSKWLENVTNYCSEIGCNSKSSLARRLIYQQQNDENMNTKQAQEINEPEFEMEVLRCAQPALVGFLASWSKPSRLVEPILDEVANACNAKIFKVNVDDNPDLGTIYSIQSVPTLIYFFDGAVRAKIVGMVSPKAILAKLNSIAPGNTSTKDIESSRG